MIDAMAWLILRIVFAGFFLYPIYGFLQNWSIAQQTAMLIYPKYANFQAVIMIVAMVIISLSILFGIYGHVGGFIAVVYCLLGVRAHLALAHKLRLAKLSDSAADGDKIILTEAASLGAVGHVTSAQKNLVIAAMAFFFMLLGTGPLSITS